MAMIQASEGYAPARIQQSPAMRQARAGGRRGPFWPLVLAILCLLLAGCRQSFEPITGASVTHWRDGRALAPARPMSDAQVQGLSAWLRAHPEGWHPVAATHAPAISLSVTHADGSVSGANLMSATLVVGDRQRHLSAAESAELHALVGR